MNISLSNKSPVNIPNEPKTAKKVVKGSKIKVKNSRNEAERADVALMETITQVEQANIMMPDVSGSVAEDDQSPYFDASKHKTDQISNTAIQEATFGVPKKRKYLNTP